MKLRNIGLALGLAGLGITANSMSARALDFSFSFPVDLEVTTGSSISVSIPSQNISGLIQGLNNNATSNATDIIITSDPVLETTSSGPITLSNAVTPGQFTVSNGVITNVQNVDFSDASGDNIYLNYQNVLPLLALNGISSSKGIAYTGLGLSLDLNTYNFQLVPWAFNPGEIVGLGVPLMMGLRVLRKNLASR
jgi:hypothetical protein